MKTKKTGNELFAEKKYPEAIHLYEVCMELDPEFLPAYLNRAAARLEIKDYEGAISDCKYVLAVDDTKAKAWHR